MSSSSSSLSDHAEMDESDKLDVASNEPMDEVKAYDVPLPPSPSLSQSDDRAHFYDDAHIAAVTNSDTALNRSSDEIVKNGTSPISSDEYKLINSSTDTEAEVETATHIQTSDDNHPSRSQTAQSDVTTAVAAMTTMMTMLMTMMTTMVDSPLARIEKLPNDILLYIANEFLTDYETVQFAHGSLDLFHRLRHYNIKYMFYFTYLVRYNPSDLMNFRCNIHQRLDKHVPSYNARQRWRVAQSWNKENPTLQTTPNYHSRIGRMKRVSVTPKDGIVNDPLDFSFIPRSVQHITTSDGCMNHIQISMKEMKDLFACDVVSFAHQKQWFSRYNYCFVRLTPEEYAERHQHEPLPLPSTLRHFVMPIFFVGNSYKLDDCIEADPNDFITLPPSLTYLQTPPSAYSHKLILPDTLHTLHYGGGRQGTRDHVGCDNDDGGGSGSGSGSTELSQWPKLPCGLKVLTLNEHCKSPLKPLIELPSGLTEMRLKCDLPLDSIASVAVTTGWPSSLTNLILPPRSDHSLSHLTLPPSLESLRFGSWTHLDYKELAQVRFPASLKHLSCYIKHQSLGHIILPEGLTSLEINGKYSTKHLPRVYPSTLTRLRLHSRWKTSYSLPTLSNLTSLSIDYDPNMKLDVFPSVTQLTILCWEDTRFESTCNSQLNLPPRLATLTFSSCDLPMLLASNMTFADISWPQSLTTIRFKFMRADLQTFKPPPWVTHLVMPYAYSTGDQDWSMFHFPIKLRQISIGSDEFNNCHLTHMSQPILWPSSLTQLKLKFMDLPTNREKLKSLSDWLPPTLTQLHIDCRGTRDFEDCNNDIFPFQTFPSSLKQLRIISYDAFPAHELVQALAHSCLETLVIWSLRWCLPSARVRNTTNLQLPSSLTTLHLTSVSHMQSCGWDKFVHRLSPESPLRVLFLDDKQFNSMKYEFQNHSQSET